VVSKSLATAGGGRYSLTVESEENREWEPELAEKVVPYEARLEWLSENLCRGEHDLGLTGSKVSSGDSP